MKVVALITLCTLLLQAHVTTAFPSLKHSENWVSSWTGAPQLTETGNLPPVTLAGATLRQYIHASIGGSQIRVVLSNAFGNEPVTFTSVNVALAAGNKTGDGLIQDRSSRSLRFRGSESVTIQPGGLVVSDVLKFAVKPMANLAISSFSPNMPTNVTGHPGSRTTSYIAPGNQVLATNISTSPQTNHWYYITALQVLAPEESFAIAVLGDSITDGRGSTTNGNDRWPDLLSAKLQSKRSTNHIAVINQGVGGGRVLRHGLGQSAVSRLDADVIAQPGVKYLILFEGINDIGTAVGPRANNATGTYATANDIIDAFDQIITRANAHGITVVGCTLLPFGGNTGYDTPASENDRVAVNEWIRKSGRFDYVVDFEKATKDPQNPKNLLPSIDTGDHLHVNVDGYKLMVAAIDLNIFRN